MLTRRQTLIALAVLPLAGCAAPGATVTPARSGGTASASGMAASGAEVVVYAPGALAAQTRTLAAAYAAAGLGTLSFEIGHTPVQREQLAKGATPDVWIAANPVDMASTADAGFVVRDAVTPFAATRLVVVVAPGNPAGVETLTDLARPGVKVLLAADTLPIWAATKKTFDKVEVANPGFGAAVLANTVSRELGVQAIVQKVQLGEADAGIVFMTDVPGDRSGLLTVAVDDAVNSTLTLSVAPVTAGKNRAGADVFITFLTEGAGHDVLSQGGYLPPAE